MLKLLSINQTLSRVSPSVYRTWRCSISTKRISASHEQDILVEQRKNRPMSPHLQIYQPQLTWYLSSLHRITGVAFAFGLVGGLFSYAAFPLIGMPFHVSDLANYWATFHPIIKTTIKTVAVFPFSFHAWNGIRHLIWDSGHELSLKGVYRTGYAVLGLALLTSLGISLY